MKLQSRPASIPADSAIDAISMGYSSIDNLGGLFRAICKLTDDNSTVYNLAHIG